MKLHTSLISIIALAALPLVSFAAPATSSSTFGGTAIPGGNQSTSFVISKSGAYYLASDRVMTADVAGIVVNVPDVTIDLNGSTLRFSTGSAANGIEIPAVSNVEIRNGSINDVPGDAINAVGGSGLRVIDVRVTTAGRCGISSTTSMVTIDRSSFSYCSAAGILILPTELTQVTRCAVTHNGQGITVAGPDSEVTNCRVSKNQRSGIALNGGLVLNNVVSENNLGKYPGEGGIYLGQASTARGNVVTLNNLNAIYVYTNQSVIEGNSLMFTKGADGFFTGTAINNPLGGGKALYLNNRISSTSSVVGGWIDGGGNIMF